MKLIKYMSPEMNNTKINSEKGFALLVTLGILTGLLSIIVPLVILNNYNSKQLTETPLETEGIINKHNSNTVALWSIKSPSNGISKLQRNYSLPGWRNSPLPMETVGNVTSATTPTITIRGGLIPVFMQTASCFNSVGKKMFLSTSLAYSTGTPSIDLNGGVAQTTSTLPIYLIIGNELILKDGATITRGVAGVQSAHKKGELVYAIPQDGIESYYLRVGSEYITITANNWDCSPGGGFSNITNNLSSTVSADRIYFCKYKTLNSDKSAAYVNSKVIDERSKININSLSKQMVTNLITYPLGSASYTTEVIKQMQSSVYWPRKSPNALMQGTGITAERYSAISGIITTYSEPSYHHMKDAYSKTDITTIGSPTDNVLLYQTASSGNYISGKKPYLQHPVNFNTASQFTMALILESMNIGTIDSTNALLYAKEIIKYRSGENPDTEVINYFDGDENPFDGYGRTNGIHYGSAEAEFIALMETVAPTHIKSIKAHVYARHIIDYLRERVITTPICFEFGSVTSIETSASVSKNISKSGNVRFQPIYASTSHTIVKDFNNWDEDQQNILIDSTNGWNEALSTASNVDFRQPSFTIASTLTHEISLRDTSANKDLISGRLFGYLGGYVFDALHIAPTLQIAHVSPQANVQGNVFTLMDSTLTTNETGAGGMFDIGLRITNGNTFQGNNHITGLAANYTYAASTNISLSGNLSAWPSSGRINVHDYANAGSSGSFVYSDITIHGSSSNLTLTSSSGEANALLVAPPANLSTNIMLAMDEVVASGFYETCLIRENVTWDTIEINGRKLLNGATLDWRTKNSGYTSVAPASDILISASPNTTSDMLFIRINLTNSGLSGQNFIDGYRGSPQIFQIRVAYTPIPGRTRIIYSQEK